MAKQLSATKERRGSHRVRENLFASCTSDKGLITKLFRELKKLNS
jgi:hypothetical protein